MSEQPEARGQGSEISPERPATFVPDRGWFTNLPAANHAASQFNRVCPVGTPVIYWPIGFQSAARIGRLRDFARSRELKPGDGWHAIPPSRAFVAEVYVDGHGGGVSLAYVALITPANMRGQLRLEFTAEVVLDLELAGPHSVPNFHAAIGQAIAPLTEALVSQLQKGA